MIFSKLRYGVSKDRLLAITADWMRGKLFSLPPTFPDFDDPKRDAFLAFANYVDEIIAKRNVNDIKKLPKRLIIRLDALHSAIFAEDIEREATILRMPKKDQPILREIADSMREVRSILLEEKREREEMNEQRLEAKKHARKEMKEAKKHAENEMKEAKRNFNTKKFNDSFFGYGSGYFENPPIVPRSNETWRYAKEKSLSGRLFDNPFNRFLIGVMYRKLDPETIEEFEQILEEYKSTLAFEERYIEPPLPEILSYLDKNKDDRWLPGFLTRFLSEKFGKKFKDGFCYIKTKQETKGWEVIRVRNSRKKFDGVYVDIPTHYFLEIGAPSRSERGVSLSVSGTKKRIDQIKFKKSDSVSNKEAVKSIFFENVEIFLNEYFRSPLNNTMKTHLKDSSKVMLNGIEIEYSEKVSRPHFSEPDCWIYLELSIKRS